MKIKEIQSKSKNIELGINYNLSIKNKFIDLDFYLLMLDKDNTYKKKENIISFKNTNSTCNSIISISDLLKEEDISDGFSINFNKIPFEIEKIVVLAAPFQNKNIEPNIVETEIFIKDVDNGNSGYCNNFTIINVSNNEINNDNHCFKVIEFLRNENNEWFHCLKENVLEYKSNFDNLDNAFKYYQNSVNFGEKENLIPFIDMGEKTEIKISDIEKNREIKLNF